ncbi:MAG: hypothetical protein HRT35_11575 [Algicola sp.]|nr:hypothetical protein [Algicola sp.]
MLSDKTLSKTEVELEQYIEEGIAVCDAKIVSLKDKIAVTEGTKKNLDEAVTHHQRELENAQSQQRDLSNNLSFDELRAFLSTNAIEEDAEIIAEQIDNLVKARQLSLEQADELQNVIKNTITEVAAQVPLEYQDSDIQQLQSAKTEREKKLAELNSQLSVYQEVLALLDVKIPQTEAEKAAVDRTANAVLISEKTKIKLQHDQLQNLELLQTLATHLIDFGDKNELQKTVDWANQELKLLDSIRVPLENDLKQISNQLEQSVEQYFHTDLINQLYKAIEPHPDFKDVEFDCKIPETGDKPELHVRVKNENDGSVIAPSIDFSSAQINVLSLSIFLARALNTKDDKGEPVDCIFIDDPIQSMDSINVLGLIDLFRNISYRFNKQLIISTHDENFHELLKRKIPTDVFGSKYLKLETFGKVVVDQS